MCKTEKYYKDTGKMNSELVAKDSYNRKCVANSYKSRAEIIKVKDFTLEFTHVPHADLVIIDEKGFKHELGKCCRIDNICTESMYVALQIHNRACSPTAATKSDNYILVFKSKVDMLSFINRVLISGIML